MDKFFLKNISTTYKGKRGRPRNDSKTTIQLLERKSYKLLEKAIELALKGNVSILVKLLDKILPTLERREAETILNINQKVSQLTDAERKQRLIELIQKASIVDAEPVALIESSDNIAPDNNSVTGDLPDTNGSNPVDIPVNDIQPIPDINDMV